MTNSRTNGRHSVGGPSQASCGRIVSIAVWRLTHGKGITGRHSYRTETVFRSAARGRRSASGEMLCQEVPLGAL